MKARDYIENKLNELVSRFDDIQIRYEYRNNTRSHLVEIIPLSFFEENEEYFEEEVAFEDEFEQLFPSENIVFISEGSLTEIKTPHLKLGYEKIKFNNEVFTYFPQLDSFSEAIETTGCENNYALAA